MNALQNLIGHDSRQLTVWIVAIFVMLAVFYRMTRASRDLRDRAEAMMADSGASLALGVKASGGKSLVVRLNKDTVQKARELLRAGNDLESVCREIEPEYGNWRTLQQHAFRRAIEMVLSAEPTAQNSSQITTLG
jgi:hypothetical protein